MVDLIFSLFISYDLYLRIYTKHAGYMGRMVYTVHCTVYTIAVHLAEFLNPFRLIEQNRI